MLISTKPITYRELAKLQYPVYELWDTDFFNLDGLIISDTGLLLDDRNCTQNSLGLRRLNSPQPHKRVVLRRAKEDITDILHSKAKRFIDSRGLIFGYRKTITCKLVYHRILKLEKLSTYSLVWVAEVPSPFYVKRPPDSSCTYAGVLYITSAPWIIYEYTNSSIKPTRRKI